MSAHTPGPWRAVPNAPGISDTVIDSGRMVVADVISRKSTDELRANARLIAAAPDLLEALRALVDLQEANEASETKALDFWDHARAAIAKATGGAPDLGAIINKIGGRG